MGGLSDGAWAVETQDLTHRFGSFLALDAVTLTVPRAVRFALLGPNGCGKTTLFRILTTLLRPTSGSARVAGVNVVSDAQNVLRHLGVAFQKPSLDGKLTALENLLYHGKLYGLYGPSLRVRAGEWLERFGIADRANDRVEKLSGGLQRRVELAKAMIHGPQVLILDEPSTGLDPGARTSLMQCLTELRDRDGVTCLITTHIMDEADHCDCVAVMDRGKLVALDAPAALKGRIGGDVVAVHSRRSNEVAARIAEQLQVRTEVVGETVRFEHSKGHEIVPKLVGWFGNELEGISVSKPTLEDVFVHLTGHSFRD